MKKVSSTTPEDQVEVRQHQRYPGRSEMGRSTDRIVCPFCGIASEVYIWSLAGRGKRCPCGALHTNYGYTRHLKDR